MAVAEIPDLWPTDLTGQPTLTPVAVLRRQGEALGRRTHNLVYGEVETKTRYGGTGFEHQFVLAAPLLNFRYPLFQVTHGILPYPVTLSATQLLPGLAGEYLSAADENVFRDGLRTFFDTVEVKQVIRSLLAQSTESDAAPSSSSSASSATDDDSIPF